MNDAAAQKDLAALAKGGRTNFIGFLLRLAARVPFLFIAGRLYGADSLGRFASALVVIELSGLLGSVGLKRGLAQRLSEEDRHPANVVGDALLVSLAVSGALACLFWAFPAPMFPSGIFSAADLWLPLAIPPLAPSAPGDSSLPEPWARRRWTPPTSSRVQPRRSTSIPPTA